MVLTEHILSAPLLLLFWVTDTNCYNTQSQNLSDNMNISHVQECLWGFAKLSIQWSRKEKDRGGTHFWAALATKWRPSCLLTVHCPQLRVKEGEKFRAARGYALSTKDLCRNHDRILGVTQKEERLYLWSIHIRLLCLNTHKITAKPWKIQNTIHASSPYLQFQIPKCSGNQKIFQ